MTAVPPEWLEHRRGDGEVLGWMVPDGDGFRVHDLLGRAITNAPIDWLDAEETLDDLGIGYLAEKWMLRLDDGSHRPVRIAEASPLGVTVVSDDFGSASAVGATLVTYRLRWPVGDELQLR